MWSKLLCWRKGHIPSGEVRIDTSEYVVSGSNIRSNTWTAYRKCKRCGQEYEVSCEKLDEDRCIVGYEEVK